jgi:hypothetical protein
VNELRRRLEQALERLAPRERALLGVAACVTAAIVVWLLATALADRRSALAAQIAASERDLTEVTALRDRYAQLRSENEQIQRALARSGADFSLFSRLEELARADVGRERIAAMNPSTRSLNEDLQWDDVEMRLSGVSLRELVTLLHGVEKGDPPLLVSRLQMKKRFDQPYVFDATVMVSRLRPKAAPAR